MGWVHGTFRKDRAVWRWNRGQQMLNCPMWDQSRTLLESARPGEAMGHHDLKLGIRPSRRAFLQVGYSGLLRMGLPGLLAGRAAAAPGSRPGRAKSVIVILLSGGLGQHDSFDMKPEAPDGIRGEFKPINTATPGLQ